MLYNNLVIGGVLIHADRPNHKYIQKVKTKSGKWRYIYKDVKNRFLSNQAGVLFNKDLPAYQEALSEVNVYPEARKLIDNNNKSYTDLGLDIPYHNKWASEQLEKSYKYYADQLNGLTNVLNKNYEKYNKHKNEALKTESNWRRQEMEDRRSKADTAKKQKSMSIRDEMLKLKKRRKKH